MKQNKTNREYANYPYETLPKKTATNRTQADIQQEPLLTIRDLQQEINMKSEQKFFFPFGNKIYSSYKIRKFTNGTS